MSTGPAERIHAGLIYALAAILVVTAVALTGLRLAVTYAPDFHSEIEAALARWLNRPVTVSALEARLTGFTPVLILHDVRIGGAPDRQADLAADRFEVSIDPWHTLLNLEPRVAELSVDGLAITLTRLVDGHAALGEQANRLRNGLLASTSRLRLRDASVTVIDPREDTIWRLEDVHAMFWHDAGVHHLAARFIPAQPRLAKRVEFAVSWQGLPRSLADINGSGYLHLLAGRFDRIGAALPPDWNVPVVAGRGDARIWMTLRQGRPKRVAVETSIRGLELGGAGAVRFQRLAGRSHWQRTDSGWDLDINALRLQRPGTLPAPPGAVSVRYSTDAEGAALWRARASSLQLGDIAVLARGNDRLPLKWRRRIARLAPHGEIADAALLIRATDQERRWRVSGRFQDLMVQPVAQLPGLTAGVGRFLITERGGRLRVDARNTKLMLPELFVRPVALERLQVQSEWRIADGRLQLAIPRFQASSAGGELEARFGLWFGEPQGPFIEARAHLQHDDAGQIRRYLPERVMAEGLSEWLQHAIRGGRIRAELVLRGRAADFPYRNGAGVFEVKSQVDNLKLAYHPDWPMLNGLGGRLLFHQGAFRAELDRGHVYRSAVIHATADVPDLMQPRLEVRCRIVGPGDDLLRFVRQSPLADDHAEVLRQVSLSGQQRLDLQLAVPFGGRPIEVDGRINLDGARLAANDLGLVIEDLTGRVGFDENGVSWDALRGRFNDHTLVSRAATGGPPGERRIRIETRFRSSVAALLGADHPLAARFRGATDWRLEIDGDGFRATERRLDLTLESELRGVRVNLPQPLAKSRSRPRLLRLHTQLSAAGPGPIRVHYADAGSAVLTLTPEGQGVERLGLHLGRGEARLPKGTGTQLTGALERLDLAELIGSGPGTQTIELPPLRAVDLRVGTLSWPNARLVQALHLSARRRPDDWFIQLAGPDVAGWIHWPRSEQGRAVVNLARLRLAGLSGLTAGNDRRSRSRPLTLPGVDLHIADLRVGAASFGHLSMRLERASDGLALEAMNLIGPVLKARVVGRWSDSGQRGHSAVDFNVASEDTGKALALFGFAKAIGNGTTDARAHLRWPGTLLDFTPATVTGNMRFTIRDGSLLKIQPGAGRIFGLLSVATLPRRLALDFSDLFGKGLAFDRIKADFRLENGTAYPEMFYIDSPAARIEVSGPIDLVKGNYDQTVTVMPHVSSAVSVLGGLAGGPLAGVILFLTQKLLQVNIGQLAQNQYRITGSWEHPRIEGVGWTRAEEVPGVANDPM